VAIVAGNCRYRLSPIIHDMDLIARTLYRGGIDAMTETIS
jgi:ketol-acid reductoisomerase